MDANLAELISATDSTVLGERIRSARVAAGLTQKELAAGVISAAYLSRLEAGERRTDSQVLQKLSARLGVTLEILVTGVTPDMEAEWQLALDLAELAAASGQASDALAGVDSLLEDDDLMRRPALLERARRLRARALEASGDLPAAIQLLEELTRGRAGDAVWINDLIALSRCYRVAGDLGRAVEVGEGAKATLAASRLEGTAESIQLALTVAAAHFERGDVDRAALICGAAVSAADQLGSPAAMAAAYWNAGIIESRRGDARTAVPMVQKALRVLESGEDARNLARIRNQLGVLQLRMDPPQATDAKENLERAAVELSASSASLVDRAHNDLSRAKAHFLLGEVELAQHRLHDGYEAIKGISPIFEATALVLRGQIDAAQGRIEDARANYRQAIFSLTAAGADRSAGEVWYELGLLLDDLALHDEARDAYRNAAACMGLTPRRVGATVALRTAASSS